jgi:hypothetical protein
MAYTDDEGVKHPSSFVNKVLALSHISDEREEICSAITKSEVESIRKIENRPN